MKDISGSVHELKTEVKSQLVPVVVCRSQQRINPKISWVNLQARTRTLNITKVGSGMDKHPENQTSSGPDCFLEAELQREKIAMFEAFCCLGICAVYLFLLFVCTSQVRHV